MKLKCDQVLLSEQLHVRLDLSEICQFIFILTENLASLLLFDSHDCLECIWSSGEILRLTIGVCCTQTSAHRVTPTPRCVPLSPVRRQRVLMC